MLSVVIISSLSTNIRGIPNIYSYRDLDCELLILNITYNNYVIYKDVHECKPGCISHYD